MSSATLEPVWKLLHTVAAAQQEAQPARREMERRFQELERFLKKSAAHVERQFIGTVQKQARIW